MKTTGLFIRSLLVLAVAPGGARADIPPPDIVACKGATEGGTCCGGTRKCVLSTCSYYQFAYSGTDASIAPGPARDAAAYEAGVDGLVGPPEKTWYPCLSCSGLTLAFFCPDAGVPDVAPPASPDGAVDAPMGNLDGGSGGQTGGNSAQTGGQAGGSGGKLSSGSGRKHGGGGCAVGGWLSARTLAPWALAGLFAAFVSVVRRRRP